MSVKASPVVTFPSEEGPPRPRPQEPGLVITHCLAAQNASAARGQLRRLDVTAASEFGGRSLARSIVAFLQLLAPCRRLGHRRRAHCRRPQTTPSVDMEDGEFSEVAASAQAAPRATAALSEHPRAQVRDRRRARPCTHSPCRCAHRRRRCLGAALASSQGIIYAPREFESPRERWRGAAARKRPQTTRG